MENKLSNKLFIIKAFSVFTIVLAHTPINYLNESYIKDLIGSFAICGVPIFFILSGYFFSKTKKSFAAFWKGKVTSIIVPWLLASILNYSKRFIKGFYFKPIEIIEFVIGYNSFFYYLTILCLLYLLFWKLRNNEVILKYSIITTIVFRYLISFGIIDVAFDNNLNILKWIGFFALGILIDKKDIINDIFTYISKNKYKLIILSLTGIVVSLFVKQMWLIEELSWIIIFIILSNIGNSHIEKLFILVGQTSFSIYLYHQFLTTKFFVDDAQLTNIIYALIRPIIIVLLLTVVFALGYYMSKKISEKLNYIYILISGTRLK